jgi:hypothetical protein
MIRFAILFLTAWLAWAADVSGTWIFDVETSAGSGTPTFVLKQNGEKLSGTYSGALGAAEISGTVKGNQIRIEFIVNLGGDSGKVVYTGTIESPTRMKGNCDLGGVAEGTWTGNKK